MTTLDPTTVHPLGDWLHQGTGDATVRPAFGKTHPSVRAWPSGEAQPLRRPMPQTGLAPDSTPANSERTATGHCAGCEELARQAEEERVALLEQLREPYAQSAVRLRQTAVELNRRYSEDVIQLAVRLAREVVGRAVELDPEAVFQALHRALESAGPVQTAVVHCHPADAELIAERDSGSGPGAGSVREGEDVLSRIALEIAPSPDIDRGGCVVLFEEGTADARVSTQLEVLADAVREAVLDTKSRGGGPQ